MNGVNGDDDYDFDDDDRHDKRQGKIISHQGRDIFGHMTHIPVRHPVISYILGP